MYGIDDTRAFKPINIAILTVSDSRTIDTDTSGQLLADRIVAAGHSVHSREIVRDEIPLIRSQLQRWINEADIHAIISTGGTGLTGRDRTPEAVRPLFEKEIEGFSIMFHMKSYESVGLSTLQSRACAGLANNTFVFCLPGSNGAVKDGWDKVIKDQLDSRHRPCNMIELLPRLDEI